MHLLETEDKAVGVFAHQFKAELKNLEAGKSSLEQAYADLKDSPYAKELNDLINKVQIGIIGLDTRYRDND